jgi:hypothetical protein
MQNTKTKTPAPECGEPFMRAGDHRALAERKAETGEITL